MDGGRDEWMDGWVDGWMYGWMNGLGAKSEAMTTKKCKFSDGTGIDSMVWGDSRALKSLCVAD